MYSSLNSAPLFTVKVHRTPGVPREVPRPPARALGRPPWYRSPPLTPVPQARAPHQTARTLLWETAWLAANWPFTSMVFNEQDILDRFQVYEGWRGSARAAHLVGGDVLGIPRGVPPARKEGALALAHFLMSRDAQALLAQQNAWPSIRRDAYGAVPGALRETFDAIQKALADGWIRPNVAHWPDVSDAMNEAVRRILQRGEPVKPVLDALHETIVDAARRKGAPSNAPPASRARGNLFERPSAT